MHWGGGGGRREEGDWEEGMFRLLPSLSNLGDLYVKGFPKSIIIYITKS